MSISAVEVRLAPIEPATVTVTLAPGSPVPQGIILHVAVEGYAGSELLGGVVIDIVVPKYVPFAPYHVYLPVVRK